MIRRVAAIAAMVAACVLLASATGDLFTMDMSSGAQSLAGFNSERTSDSGVTFTKSYQATGGPGGTPSYRITSLHDAAQAATGASVFWGGEYYTGWNVDTGAAPPSGSTRYTRFRARVLTSNCRFINSQDGGQPEPGVMKLIIVGDGEPGRTIVETACDPDTGGYAFRMARDGGNYGSYAADFDDWYSIQLRTVTGAGGSLAMWINNDNVASPDFNSGTVDMGSAFYDGIGFGYYQNRMVTSTGTYTYELADLEYATTFDATWYANMGSGGGATVPDPPTIGTATAGNAQCSVAFTPPGDDGGATITGYTATSTPGSFTGTGASSPITVTGLSNGTGYTFTVYATNSEGNSSASSASNTCTPAAAATRVRLRLRGQ